MKTSFSVLVGILLFCSLSSCKFINNSSSYLKPSDKNITRNYNVTDFNAIEATTVGDIYYTQSTDGSSSLKIYGPDNFVNLIQVTVKGETLIMSMDNRKKIKNAKGLTITVCSPNLNRINFGGVGDIKINEKLTADNLDIESKGVGDIQIDLLDCQKLNINSIGVGNINLKGKAETATLYSKGVGNIEAADLEVMHLKASSNGVGDISCNAVESLDASVKGVGSINYKGSPAQTNFNKKGVGSIKRI